MRELEEFKRAEKREEKRKEIREAYGDKFNLLPVYPGEYWVGGKTMGDYYSHGSMVSGNPLFKRDKEGFNTFVSVHGGPRISGIFGQKKVAKHDVETIKKIIQLTKRSAPSNDLLILSMCNVNDKMAKYLAKKACRKVVYFNGIVLEKMKLSGDTVMKSESGKNLKMAYPDGRKSHEISKKFMVPVSVEMSRVILYDTPEHLLYRREIANREIANREFPITLIREESPRINQERLVEMQALVAEGGMSFSKATKDHKKQNPITKKKPRPSNISKIKKSFKM